MKYINADMDKMNTLHKSQQQTTENSGYTIQRQKGWMLHSSRVGVENGSSCFALSNSSPEFEWMRNIK